MHTIRLFASFFFATVFSAAYGQWTTDTGGNVSTTGNASVSGSLWVLNAGTVSSEFNDTNFNTWNTNFSVRNASNTTNTFSRLTFVSGSGGYATIIAQKTGEFSGDLNFQVRSGPGYYVTPMTIRSNGFIGAGGYPHKKFDAGYFQDGGLSNMVVIRVRNTVAQNAESGWGSAIEFYNMSNNLLDAGFVEGGAKIISEASNYGWNSNLKFRVVRNNNFQSQTGIDAMTITHLGLVGIGTVEPDEALTVKGKIHTSEVRVDLEPEVAPDYVFEKDYNLMSLSEVEAYINANKHLPEVPSAKEMDADGMNLKEMNLILLKKVEELTLHLIEANKRISALETKQE